MRGWSKSGRGDIADVRMMAKQELALEKKFAGHFANARLALGAAHLASFRPVLLDAHQHFWRYDAAQYPWIAAGSPLHRDWLPTDLAALERPLGIGGSIAVQARQSLAESDWLLGLAD